MRISIASLIILTFAFDAYSQQPEQVVILEGKVLDEKTREPVAAEVDIFFDSDFMVDDVQITNEGTYSSALKHFGWYIIDVSAPGYLSKTDTVWITDYHRKNIVRDHYLKRIEIGLTVVLDNLYFYFGKTELKPESHPSLDKVAEFFNENPHIRFEIGGHTDDEGAEDYNMMLSEGRAKAVVDYLVQKGIDAGRLVAKGYGESRPIDAGITKAAKARNRRVEFVVLDVGG